MQLAFGSGSMWGVDSGANPTPSKFGILQDVGLDFTATLKELFGQYKMPVAIGQGTTKIAWKAKFAQLSGRVFNSLFFNGTKAVGSVQVAEEESGTIAAGSVTVANSANFIDDLGVRYAATGLPFTRVAAAPATGQYAVAAGVYTFNVAENDTVVKIDYTHEVAGSGEKITISNQLIGAAAQFKSVFTQVYGGKRQTFVLNANVSEKLVTASKLEDFNIPEMDGKSFADSANNIGTWSLGEAS